MARLPDLASALIIILWMISIGKADGAEQKTRAGRCDAGQYA
jgi:hypothetical protein